MVAETSNTFPGIVSALTVSLPIFVIWYFNQQAASAFNKGWAEGGNLSLSARTFWPSPIYAIFVAPFVVVMWCLFWPVLRDPLSDPFGMVLALFPLFGLPVLLLALYYKRLSFDEEKIVYRSLFRTRVIRSAGLTSVTAKAGLIMIYLSDGEIESLPMIWSNPTVLGKIMRTFFYAK